MKRLLPARVVALLLTGAENAAVHPVSVDEQFDVANKLYAGCLRRRRWRISRSSRLVGFTGVVFQLGNAHFKSGQLGRAIAAYRQAEELAPRDPDLRANVQFTQSGGRPSHVFVAAKLGTFSATEWMGLPPQRCGLR